MSESLIYIEKMEIEEEFNFLPRSFSSYSYDSSAIFSEDPLENRINEWLDN